MNETDKPRLVQALAAAAATFRQDATEAMFYGYWIGLGDLPIEAVEQAIVAAIRTCRFLPTVAELRELAGDVRTADRAVVAWAAFDQAVTCHGGYASVDFDDPLINATVRTLGGWERCCELSPEEFDKWLRKDFLRTYEALAAAGISAEAAMPLGGYCDRMNAGLGFREHVKQPVRIATGLPPRPGIAAPGPVTARSLPPRPAKRPALGAEIGRMP